MVCALDLDCGRPCGYAAQVPAVLADRERGGASGSVHRQIVEISVVTQRWVRSAKLCRKPRDSTGKIVATPVVVQRLCGGRRRCHRAATSSSSSSRQLEGPQIRSSTVLRARLMGFRRIWRPFSESVHLDVESPFCADFFGALDDPQLFVIEGSRFQLISAICGKTLAAPLSLSKTTIIPTWRGSVKTGEEPPLHSGEVNHAKQAAQPNPSYPALCRQDTTSPWSTDNGANKS